MISQTILQTKNWKTIVLALGIDTLLLMFFIPTYLGCMKIPEGDMVAVVVKTDTPLWIYDYPSYIDH